MDPSCRCFRFRLRSLHDTPTGATPLSAPSPAPLPPPAPLPTPPRHCPVLIVGGGCAGITLAHVLRQLRPALPLTLLEPAAEHDYQPGWTLVGGGLMPLEQTRRPERDLIPPGVVWIQAAASAFEPARHRVISSEGQVLTYDALVVATGLVCRWGAIAGLEEALGHGGVCSNYARDGSPYTWEAIEAFRGGNAVFTIPDTPIKCGGGPQKVMYMADDRFRARSGVGVNSRVIFCTPQRSLFALPEYARTLAEVVRRRGIAVRYGWTLQQVDGPGRRALFAVTDGEGDGGPGEGADSRLEWLPYDLLHAVPPMGPPPVVAGSPLAGAGGWVEVDPYTLRHPRFADVFALGDVAGLPTSKTAGAVRQQVPVLAANLVASLERRPLTARYDGYTVCPLITGYGAVMMAEFDYRQIPISSFLVDPTRERWSLWLLKTRLLPWIYWNRMLRGAPHEAAWLRPLAPLAQALRLDHRPPPLERPLSS